MQFQEINTVTNYQWSNNFMSNVNDNLLSSSGESALLLKSADSTFAQSSNLVANEPVNPYRELVLEDSEILVIPEIVKIELLLVPIEPITQMPPSLGDGLPLQTTLEDGELFHTPIWTNV